MNMVRFTRGSQPQKTCDARIICHFPVFLLDILRDAPHITSINLGRHVESLALGIYPRFDARSIRGQYPYDSTLDARDDTHT